MSRKVLIIMSVVAVIFVFGVIALWQRQRQEKPGTPIDVALLSNQTNVQGGSSTKPVAPVASYADALAGIKSFYNVSLMRLGSSDEERLRNKEGWGALLQTVRQQLEVLVVPKTATEEQLNRLTALSQYIEAVRRGELAGAIKVRERFEQSLR